MNNKQILDKALELVNNNIETELIKILKISGSAPRTLDAFMIAYREDNKEKNIGTIGGGLLEFEALKDAYVFLDNKETSNKKYNLTPQEAGGIGMVCGGSAEISFIYLNNNKDIINNIKKEIEDKESNVYIFGGGHVSYDLVEVLYRIGFNCIVIDDREEFANKDRFPNASKIIVEDYENVFDKINISDKDYIVIVTRGHSHDYIVEKNALKTDALYIGMIGSKNKIKTLHDRLKKEENYTDESISKVHAPIGIAIGAETTEEIAISIAAELILVRAKAENRRKIKN
ncbi:putative dehydrogenase accessory protein [Brachyspira hampsonii 30446]|uniref:Putative dehydrogenase accessory protein n=1 Tax=Brachyspira hampsonii 30446 TaxID=1289135 RepID=A0A2U4FGJ1_9SPIR|nr:XdhC/CoxI family protein [Brachyspira hampsonii]EKV56261.1 putative dehydrogenase accessory protein [Brachyspira hampsonii 30446]MBW5393791.1 dehydrogenase [Brachyspira hampsonii]OEJ17146.1 dehydrogenase [Brachyspira hampsonii]